MSFIAGLLFFVLFVLLSVALFVVILVMRGIRSVRRFFHIGGSDSQRATSSGQQQQSAYRYTRTSDGIIITDHRSPDEANKKIFAPDEGEYVEYTEG